MPDEVIETEQKDVPDFSELTERRLKMSGIDPNAPFPGGKIRAKEAKQIIEVILAGHSTCKNPEASLLSALDIAEESLPDGKEKEELIAEITTAIKKLGLEPATTKG